MGKSITKVLITGGAGFIGSNIAVKLAKKGVDVSVIDNLSEQIHGKNPAETSSLFRSIEGKVNFIKGSVTNRSDLEHAIGNNEAIIHLAAETGTGQSMYEIEKYTTVNVGGVALMLDILANSKKKVRKIVFASSRAIYGEGKYFCKQHGAVYPLPRTNKNMQNGDFECKCPICNVNVEPVATTEDSLIHPTSVYGISKQTQEQMIMTVCDAIGIDAVALRYQNVYGERQSLSNPYTGILSIFSTRIKNGNDINIFEDGKESRDFIHIEDVTNATISALNIEAANNRIFNIGTGVKVDVLSVAKTLIKMYGKNNNINISGNYRIGDIRHNFADITEAKTILGFNPKYDFEAGIQRFVDWVNTQSVSNDDYEKSIKELKAKGLYK